MMKRSLALGFAVAVCAFFGTTRHAAAALFPTSLLWLPFGGFTIASTETAAAVTCTSTEGAPIFIKPVFGAVPAGPYVTTPATIRYLHGVIHTGIFILGGYSPIPNMTLCRNTETGTPVPAFSIVLFGDSLAP